MSKGSDIKVCICGGTNPATNPKYFAVAQKMGEMLVAGDFEMVWGGNAFGVLSHVHKQYLDKQKANTLVLPKAYEGDLESMPTDKNQSTAIQATDKVSQRTYQMFSMVNAVVCIPGGIGTIYEFWSAVEYKRAEEFDIDIILLNYDGFFKHQLAHYDFINENGFTKIGQGGAPYKIDPKDLFYVANTPEEVIRILKDIERKRKK